MKFRMVSVILAIAAGLALATINFTAEVEPGWIERTVAVGFLRARIASSGGMRAFRTISDADAWRVRPFLAGINVPDLDPVLRALQQRGVRIVRGITSLPQFQIRLPCYSTLCS